MLFVIGDRVRGGGDRNVKGVFYDYLLVVEVGYLVIVVLCLFVVVW